LKQTGFLTVKNKFKKTLNGYSNSTTKT